ncbi:MAG: alpha/beta hydrolase [Planctomycetes bacterium]|nr:alpha/beta hydrolase [Planctomycetota bacterium]
MTTTLRRWVLVAVLAAAGGSAAAWAVSSPERDQTVVLVHGLGRSRASLLVLGLRFRREGYAVRYYPYTPATTSVEDAARGLREFVAARVRTPRYHLVGHSLGNVIIREGFTAPYLPGLGRVVMLAPPNRPPRLALRLGANPLFRLVGGDAARRLCSEEFYAGLPVPDVPFGVIAGTRGRTPGLAIPNDGVLEVGDTRLEGMTDVLELGHSHTFLMNARDTYEACLRFLQTGRFPPPERPGGGS